MFLHKEAMTSMSITAGRAMIQEKMPCCKSSDSPGAGPETKKDTAGQNETFNQDHKSLACRGNNKLT